MRSATSTPNSGDEVRHVIDQWVNALHDRDVTARTSNYASDVLLFDVINPLQHRGLDALRSRLSAWLSTFQGPVGCEVRDLTISAGDDVAFCHMLNRFSGTTAGGPLDMWVRFTVGFHKVEGRWSVTHEQTSVPFDAETGRASIDLQP